jgi:hypothetical protein
MWTVKMMKQKKKIICRNSSLVPALKLGVRNLHPPEHGIVESVVGASAAAAKPCCLWPIKCHQGYETNISNCENWKKVTFNCGVVTPFKDLQIFHMLRARDNTR